VLKNNDIWLPIKGFESRYFVSSTGQIKSLASGKLRATYVRSETCQYEYVQLFKNNKHYTFAVHRLVAEAFIPNNDLRECVNHKDGNKLNNHFTNLEWVTTSENHLHAYETGLRINAKACLGKKMGSTSQYHNVTYDRSRNRWIGSIKENQIQKQKRFKTETEAALYVNDLIDELGLKRPKNVIV
jgi:hypothetical protein